MTKRIITTALLLGFAFCSFGQKTRFAQLVEQMYFNVFDRNPNKQIQPFLKKYFPDFLGWNKNENAGWAYNLKVSDSSNIDTTVHSFIFTKHQLVRTNFVKGRLDFESLEKKADKPLISGWTLYFSFENYNDAIICFDSIYKIFDTLSKDRINLYTKQS
ncbi:MAG: hypothetical protein IPP48_06125 [Chitinophagaceae bacterium]|nr:hypothetical protein [Chitinophagaceae bacterium]